MKSYLSDFSGHYNAAPGPENYKQLAFNAWEATYLFIPGFFFFPSQKRLMMGPRKLKNISITL